MPAFSTSDVRIRDIDETTIALTYLEGDTLKYKDFDNLQEAVDYVALLTATNVATPKQLFKQGKTYDLVRGEI